MDAAFAFDAMLGKGALFGGLLSTGAAVRDLCLYLDTNTIPPQKTWMCYDEMWIPPHCDEMNWPVARHDASLVYDPGRRVLVLHGGKTGPPAYQSLYDTWELSIPQESQLTCPSCCPTWVNTINETPDGPWGTVRADYDALLRRVVRVRSFGECASAMPGPSCQSDMADCCGGEFRFEQYDPASQNWTPIWSPATEVGWPTPIKHDFTFTYDIARGEHLLYGGWRTGCVCEGDNCVQPIAPLPQVQSETSRLSTNACDWTTTIPGSPLKRAQHASVYDSKRSRTVAFGGAGDSLYLSPPLDGTLENDGTAWSFITPSVKPPARKRHSITYDPIRGRTIVYGGMSNTGGLLWDTWEYPVAIEPGTYNTTDNVTILLRTKPIEGGIRLTTFEQFATEPEFFETGEGYCERCYFSADVGGFEALHTKRDDPAYPIAWHTFEVDNAFDDLSTTVCGGLGFLARLTYWSDNTGPNTPSGVWVRSRDTIYPPATFPVASSGTASWMSTDFCINRAGLSSVWGETDIWIGTEGDYDVTFRELTLFRFNPATENFVEAPSDVLVTHYNRLNSTASGPQCATLPSPTWRYCGSTFADRQDCRCVGAQPSLGNLRPLVNEYLSPPLPVDRWGDDTVPHTPSPSRRVAILGKDCAYPYEWWSYKPCIAPDRAAKEGLFTIQYWDQPGSGKLFNIYRDVECGGGADRELKVESSPPGTPAGWKTASVLTNTVGNGAPGCVNNNAGIWLTTAGNASAANLPIGQASFSHTLVEVELPVSVHPNAPVSGWLRVRRADNTLATGFRTVATPSGNALANVALAFEASPEWYGHPDADGVPVVTSPTCVLDGAGSCVLQIAQIDRPTLFTLDAILTLLANRQPGVTFSEDVVIRSVPWSHTVVTERPDPGPIVSRSFEGGMFSINGQPKAFTGWTGAATFGHKVGNRWQAKLPSTLAEAPPTRTTPYILEHYKMEATPGDWDPDVLDFDHTPLANRIQGAFQFPPLADPDVVGRSIERAPTDVRSLDEFFDTLRAIKSSHVKAHLMTLSDPRDAISTGVPNWFKCKFESFPDTIPPNEYDICGPNRRYCGLDPGHNPIPCPTLPGENRFSQVRFPHRDTVSLVDRGSCFLDHECYEASPDRTGTAIACWNDPNFQELLRSGTERILMAAAADDSLLESLLLMQVWNEPQHGDYQLENPLYQDACYCEDCRYEWWHWLEKRYATLDVLSAEYALQLTPTAWYDVDPPELRPPDQNPAPVPCMEGPNVEPVYSSGRCVSSIPNLCRDWLLFRYESMRNVFELVDKVWDDQLVNRYPYIARLPDFDVPLTMTTMTFDHSAGSGWVWPRVWQPQSDRGVGFLDTLSGNNGLPFKPGSLQAIMRDSWQAGKPYSAQEVANLSGERCEPLPAKERRIREVGSEYVLSGLASFTWLELLCDPMGGVGKPSIAESRADATWLARNDIGRLYGRLTEENLMRNGTEAALDSVGAKRVAVLVSENSFVRQISDVDAPSGRRTVESCRDADSCLSCDPAYDPVVRNIGATYLNGLTALHLALYKSAGYAYTFITETEVLEQCAGLSPCPYLQKYHAIIMAGFHGSDLQGVDSVGPPDCAPDACYSNCGATCDTSLGGGGTHCLLSHLQNWLEDPADGRTLIGVWDRPMEEGSLARGDIAGPCVGFDEMAGLRYENLETTTIDPNVVNHYQAGTAVDIPMTSGPGQPPDLLWSDLEVGSWPCKATEGGAHFTCASGLASVILAPSQVGACCVENSPTCEFGSPALLTRHELPGPPEPEERSFVYVLTDGFEDDGLGPSRGTCIPSLRASQLGRILSLILWEQGIRPIVDSHVPIDSLLPSTGCAAEVREPWKTFGLYRSTSCDVVLVSLHNPYDYPDECDFPDEECDVPGACPACAVSANDSTWHECVIPNWSTTPEWASRGLTVYNVPPGDYFLDCQYGAGCESLHELSFTADTNGVLPISPGVSLPPGELLVMRLTRGNCTP